MVDPTELKATSNTEMFKYIVMPGAKRPKNPPVAVGRWVSARISGPADFGLRV